ncbi:hypothetical protein HY413_03560 [Candidatus Kaiserbacteria bacterium]|nr:hypothetical protein [Candidatus Kaiserbacteria bacterium]
MHILSMIGEHITDIQPGDHVQEQVPTFIQQMDALYAEKGSRMHDAHEQGDFAKAHRLFNEHSLLHSMLTYFASVAAPLNGSMYRFHGISVRISSLYIAKAKRRTGMILTRMRTNQLQNRQNPNAH